MIQLLKKELRLTASPLSFIFLAFSLMVFIPQYPILVSAFFVGFGIFQTFQKAREANDTLYTCLLPVKKTDIVYSKFAFAVFIECVALILMAVFTVLRVLLLSHILPYSINNTMNPNLAFLGYVLMIFAWFNILFIGGFFKTAYKIGIPFFRYSIVAFLTVIFGEALHFFPSLGVLNINFHPSHLVVLSIGILIYTVGTMLSIKKSKTYFEKIDL